MDKRVTEIMSRVQRLRTEVEVRGRRWEEELAKAQRGLASLSEEDVAMLSKVVPGLAVIKNYTAEDIRRDREGTVANIKRVLEELCEYTEKRLTYYEERL